ncbi:MAG: hypothetical protein WDN26_03845 [Chitinophagaceae bacterium]
MIIAGWICIALEILLLLIWVYSIFFTTNGTDPAGRGTATVFVIGLCIYIAASILLLLMGKTWSVVLVLVMAGIPLAIVCIGLGKKYGSPKKEY